MKDAEKIAFTEWVCLISGRLFGFMLASLAIAPLWVLLRFSSTPASSPEAYLLLLYVLLSSLLSAGTFLLTPRFARFVGRRLETKLKTSHGLS